MNHNNQCNQSCCSRSSSKRRGEDNNCCQQNRDANRRASSLVVDIYIPDIQLDNLESAEKERDIQSCNRNKNIATCKESRIIHRTSQYEIPQESCKCVHFDEKYCTNDTCPIKRPKPERKKETRPPSRDVCNCQEYQKPVLLCNCSNYEVQRGYEQGLGTQGGSSCDSDDDDDDDDEDEDSGECHTYTSSADDCNCGACKLPGHPCDCEKCRAKHNMEQKMSAMKDATTEESSCESDVPTGFEPPLSSTLKSNCGRSCHAMQSTSQFPNKIPIARCSPNQEYPASMQYLASNTAPRGSIQSQLSSTPQRNSRQENAASMPQLPGMPSRASCRGADTTCTAQCELPMPCNRNSCQANTSGQKSSRSSQNLQQQSTMPMTQSQISNCTCQNRDGPSTSTSGRSCGPTSCPQRNQSYMSTQLNNSLLHGTSTPPFNNNESSKQNKDTLLIEDTYSPGLIEDCVFGRKDFNSISFGIAFEDCDEIPTELPSNTPMSLLEAFHKRIESEREHMSDALRTSKPGSTATSPPGQIDVEAIEMYFSYKPITCLNEALQSLFKAEALVDEKNMAEGRGVIDDGAITYDLEVQNTESPLVGGCPITVELYTGKTSSKLPSSQVDDSGGTNDTTDTSDSQKSQSSKKPKTKEKPPPKEKGAPKGRKKRQ